MSEFWLTIIQLILMPTFIVGLLAFVMRELFKKYLLMDIEKYKGELQENLETHKAQLKAENDANQFEFQTKFSLFHQREAEAIENMYLLVTELGRGVTDLHNKPEPRQSETKEVLDLYRKYIDFYIAKQIYFDDELCEFIEQIRDSVGAMIDRYRARDLHLKHSEGNRSLLPYAAEAGEKELNLHIKFRKEFPKLRKDLRDELRKILSASKPNQNNLQK